MAQEEIKLVGSFKDDITPKLQKMNRSITTIGRSFESFNNKIKPITKSFNTLATGPIPGSLIYVIGLIAALGTSFYMWRSYYLTFEGKHAKKEISAFEVEQSRAGG